MKIKAFLKKFFVFLLFIAVVASINSCTNRPNNSKTGGSAIIKDTVFNKTSIDTAKNQSAEDSGKVPYVRKFNDIARYIAGMKAWPGSAYAKLENDSAWAKFSRNFNLSWKQLTITRLQPMAAWGATELAAARKANRDIFYPLSGPDILHANTFFPGAKNYRLYALEGNGALPNLDSMNTKEVDSYIAAIYSSLGDVFTKSYFITRKMMSSLKVENVNGTLPLICIFLVRTGHEIINIQYFHLNNDGSETPLKKDSIGNNYNDFVKVYFRNNKNTSIQTVSYMKCDLSDDAYNKNTALKNFFAKMPQSTTYLKSASYLLHYAFFSSFRNVILNKSATILEDDTGIPYKYLPKDKWDVTLYGVYVAPVEDFSGVFQSDLSKAYQDTGPNKPKKLPFSLGYHWGTNKQNLIKAELRN